MSTVTTGQLLIDHDGTVRSFTREGDIRYRITGGDYVAGEEWHHYAWKVQFFRGPRSLTVPYRTGSGLPGIPNAWDALYAAMTDAYSYENATGWEDWADEMGFEYDDRQGQKDYAACGNLNQRIHRFFNHNTEEIELWVEALDKTERGE